MLSIIIKTEKDYDRVLARINDLMDADPGTSEGATGTGVPCGQGKPRMLFPLRTWPQAGLDEAAVSFLTHNKVIQGLVIGIKENDLKALGEICSRESFKSFMKE
jgi:hypothetical protein